MSSARINSGNIENYRQIEKCLSGFFRLFENLCTLCYERTLQQINAGGHRDKVKYWCCCIADNQVHDHWDSLNAIQRTITCSDWYNKVKRRSEEWRESVQRRRLPGNGPCPAMCSKGCLIGSCRPVTCTTQLCEKMLFVLDRTETIRVDYSRPLQIEEIVNLPNILRTLYGHDRGHVKPSAISTYLQAIESLKRRFGDISKDRRRELSFVAIRHFLE